MKTFPKIKVLKLIFIVDRKSASWAWPRSSFPIFNFNSNFIYLCSICYNEIVFRPFTETQGLAPIKQQSQFLPLTGRNLKQDRLILGDLLMDSWVNREKKGRVDRGEDRHKQKYLNYTQQSKLVSYMCRSVHNNRVSDTCRWIHIIQIKTGTERVRGLAWWHRPCIKLAQVDWQESNKKLSRKIMIIKFYGLTFTCIQNPCTDPSRQKCSTQWRSLPGMKVVLDQSFRLYVFIFFFHAECDLSFSGIPLCSRTMGNVIFYSLEQTFQLQCWSSFTSLLTFIESLDL